MSRCCGEALTIEDWRIQHAVMWIDWMIRWHRLLRPRPAHPNSNMSRIVRSPALRGNGSASHLEQMHHDLCLGFPIVKLQLVVCDWSSAPRKQVTRSSRLTRHPAVEHPRVRLEHAHLDLLFTRVHNVFCGPHTLHRFPWRVDHRCPTVVFFHPCRVCRVWASQRRVFAFLRCPLLEFLDDCRRWRLPDEGRHAEMSILHLSTMATCLAEEVLT